MSPLRPRDKLRARGEPTGSACAPPPGPPLCTPRSPPCPRQPPRSPDCVLCVRFRPSKAAAGKGGAAGRGGQFDIARFWAALQRCARSTEVASSCFPQASNQPSPAPKITHLAAGGPGSSLLAHGSPPPAPRACPAGRRTRGAAAPPRRAPPCMHQTVAALSARTPPALRSALCPPAAAARPQSGRPSTQQGTPGADPRVQASTQRALPTARGSPGWHGTAAAPRRRQRPCGRRARAAPWGRRPRGAPAALGGPAR